MPNPTELARRAIAAANRKQEADMSLHDALPDHDSPRVSPFWRPLLRAPCRRCLGKRIFAEHLEQSGVAESHIPLQVGEPLDPEMADITAAATTLCGDCGDVDRRLGWVPTIEAAKTLRDGEK